MSGETNIAAAKKKERVLTVRRRAKVLEMFNNDMHPDPADIFSIR